MLLILLLFCSTSQTYETDSGNITYTQYEDDVQYLYGTLYDYNKDGIIDEVVYKHTYK